MSVRISATDWYEGGTDVEDAVAIARAFAEHGADAIHVSTGQVVKDERPAFGRSLPDAVRRPDPQRGRPQLGSRSSRSARSRPTTTSTRSCWPGGPTSARSGGRTSTTRSWTLHAAAEQGYAGPGAQWPAQFQAGSRRPQAGRTDGPRPRLELIRAGAPRTRHTRWRP